MTLCIVCSATSWATAQSNTKLSSDDDMAIRKLVATFESGWNDHNMDAIGSIFTEDGEFINVVGMHWRGEKAIVKAHAAYHEIMFKDCKLHTDEVTVRPIGSEHAVVVWVCTQDPFSTPSGAIVPKHQNRCTLVAAKRGDAWRIVHGQNTQIDAQAAQFDPVNNKK
jgi:uncharacterized protein (TIGR02246 family)